MKVKIIKCKSEYYWYKDEIGAIYDVGHTWWNDKWIIMKSAKRPNHFIDKSDCEIISNNNGKE